MTTVELIKIEKILEVKTNKSLPLVTDKLAKYRYNDNYQFVQARR